MNFLIADSFTASLARLQGQEQKAVKTTAFDLQVDSSRPGLKLHRIDRAKDPNFWSVRVNHDLRIIVHRTDTALMLCHVDHHDAAYRWAERRRIETHPRTGAAQIVETVERTEEVPVEARPAANGPLLFAKVADDELLGYGVPPEWLERVRKVDEDGLFALADHLPQEAAEALLDLAVGVKPKPVEPAAEKVDPFAHPDAQRRFRVVTNLEELEQALNYPWEKWTVFLHPAQREVVERRFGGPARVTGSAGTGKTIVALHRAAFLARQDEGSRILLATFAKNLADALKLKLARLIDPRDDAARRIAVHHVDGLAHELYGKVFARQPNMASRSQIETALATAAEELGEKRFSRRFLFNEWRHVVDAWQVRSWEAYRDVSRLGRKTRVGGKQREALWAIFEKAQASLRERKRVTWAEATAEVTAHYAATDEKPFTHAVIDEAQDVGVPQLPLLASLVPEGENRLFFAGDLGQRIFQQPYSWLSQGVDVRGRSFSLKVNYRTSHQIRKRADLLLPLHVRDVDGYEESRKGTVSVFNGPEPLIHRVDDEADEAAFVGDWLKDRLEEGMAPEEFAIFVRDQAQLDRAKAAAKGTGRPWLTLQERVEEAAGRMVIGTMHLAKGLEFRAVAVIACDDEVIPSQARIAEAADESELDIIFETERHLLYVAATRAREHLIITGVAPGSEFLEDLEAMKGG